MKLLTVEAQFFLADKRTEETAERHNEANSRFYQFCESF